MAPVLLEGSVQLPIIVVNVQWVEVLADVIMYVLIGSFFRHEKEFKFCNTKEADLPSN